MLSDLCKLFRSRNVFRYPEFVEGLQKEVTKFRVGKIEAEREALIFRKKMKEQEVHLGHSKPPTGQ